MIENRLSVKLTAKWSGLNEKRVLLGASYEELIIFINCELPLTTMGSNLATLFNGSLFKLLLFEYNWP
jgi:hypothetical protein